jgi:hypothetical protein
MANHNLEVSAEEKRRHPRVAISRHVRARADNQESLGTVTDISVSGVAIDTDMAVEDDLEVELEIDDLSPLIGHVTRSHDDGLVVEFDLDQEEEDRLLSEVMQIHNDIQLEDI